MGLEPTTSSLPRRCSTTELHQPALGPCASTGEPAAAPPRGEPSVARRGQRRMERATGIEPAWLAWKARALPLSYTRLCCLTLYQLCRKVKNILYSIRLKPACFASPRRSFSRPRLFEVALQPPQANGGIAYKKHLLPVFHDVESVFQGLRIILS